MEDFKFVMRLEVDIIIRGAQETGWSAKAPLRSDV